MMLLLYGFLIVAIIGFFLGFLLQSYCLWVDGDNNKIKPKASDLIPWLIRIKICKTKIIVLSLFREKEKLYVEAMKRKMIFGKLEKILFEGLMMERNPKKIRIILETVFQSMEKNRRKDLKNKDNKYKKYLFVKNIHSLYGKGISMPLPYYSELFVLYNRYLNGEYLSPDTAYKAAYLFGTIQEMNTAESDMKQLESEQNQKVEYFKLTNKNTRKKRYEKSSLKEGGK